MLNAKGMVDKASDNQVKLEKLCEWCCGITVQVTLMINVSPLEDCVKELEGMADRCSKNVAASGARLVSCN